MQTIVDRVVAAAGRYEGPGDGIESGPFRGVLDIEPLLDAMGADIRYSATAPDGSSLHVEHTTLALDMWSGEPTLYVLCQELAGMGQLALASDSTFSNGRTVDEFEVQIEISIDGDRIDYVWSWGAPGSPLTEQSRATLTKAPA